MIEWPCMRMRQAGAACPVLGVMSGTSLDGIDLCLATLQGSVGRGDFHVTAILDFVTVPFDPTLRQDIQTLMRCGPPPSSPSQQPPVEAGGGSSVAAPSLTMSQLLCRVNADWSRFVGRHISELLDRNCFTDLNTDSTTTKKVRRQDVVIGSHGQTIWHEVGHSTLQIGDGEMLCQMTQLPVVSNFRAADMAVGGQGAPLVPFFDVALANIIARAVHTHRDGGSHMAAQPAAAFQNLGGIGNVCLVIPSEATTGVAGSTPRASQQQSSVSAFDTGPANIVLNELIEQTAAVLGPAAWRAFVEARVQQQQPSEEARDAAGADTSAGVHKLEEAHLALLSVCDWNGAFSSQGSVVPSLLAQWRAMHADYIQARPPKSTGRERFGQMFVSQHVLPYVFGATNATPAAASTGGGESAIVAHMFQPQHFLDACRTAVQLTADTIALSFKQFLPLRPDIVALSGGGALNPVMAREIYNAVNTAYEVPSFTPVASSSLFDAKMTEMMTTMTSATSAADRGPLPHSGCDAVMVVPCSKLLASLGIPLGHAAGEQSLNFDDAKEALAFAVLAHERVNFFAGATRQGTNVVTATGASRCVSLGQLSLPTTSQ